MELARHWPGALRVAAPLKRLDRLLSNQQVQAVRARVYEAAVAWVVRQTHPTVLVDWSEITGDGRWQLLRASVALRGRSLTLYEEVHAQKYLGSPHVQNEFLKTLKALLPADCCPLIVTDAGFRTPWFEAVEALDWPWLGRVRGQVGARKLDPDNVFTPFLPISHYFAKANRTARCLGWHELTQRNALYCRLVSVRRASKGRHEIRRRAGGKARSGKSRTMARGQRDPWVLACSKCLANYSAARLVRLYGLRMQIEASFRDLKSHHYGCGFEDTQTRKGPRLAILLMIHMLATLMAWLAGIADQAQQENRFRLSLVRRGWEQIRLANPKITRKRRPPWQTLAAMVACHQ